MTLPGSLSLFSGHALVVAFSVTHVVTRLRSGLLDHVYAPPSVVVFSLAAAACYAVSAVLQQSAAKDQSAALSMRPGLLLVLVHRRRWLIGNLASVAGFVFQFLALRHGSLALVEPLLVASLAIALPLNAALEHRRLTRREWAPAVLIVAALALFLLAAQPGPGSPHAPTGDWIALGVLTAAVVGACVRWAGPSGPRRALFLATAAGILFGVTGALTETSGHLLDHGLLRLITSGAPYALIVASVLGLLLNQSAFQAGELRWSLPVITVLEPLVAIMIGEFMFDEHIATTALARTGEVVGLVAMTLGIVLFSRPTRGPSPVERQLASPARP